MLRVQQAKAGNSKKNKLVIQLGNIINRGFDPLVVFVRYRFIFRCENFIILILMNFDMNIRQYMKNQNKNRFLVVFCCQLIIKNSFCFRKQKIKVIFFE